MPGSTSNYGWSKPLGTDLASTGDEVIAGALDGIDAVVAAETVARIAADNALTAGRVAVARRVAQRTVTAGYSLLPPGIKLRGANLTIKTDVNLNTPQGWATWYADAGWYTHATEQVDRAVALGFNAVRLPGDIYGIKAGTFTQAAYNAKWVQFLDYTAAKGINVVATGILSTHIFGSTDAEINAFLTSWGAVIEPYPHVVLCDLYGEADFEYVNGISGAQVVIGGTGWTALVARIRSMAAAFRAVSTIPVSVSGIVPGASGNATWTNDLKDTLDYFDFHHYSDGQFADLNTYFGNCSKPFLIGEHGVSQNSTSQQRQTRLQTIRERIHSRPECMGSLVWALWQQGAAVADDYSIFGPARAIANKALTANVATITTAVAHGFIVGDVVTLTAIASPFAGRYSVATVPTTTTFTFARSAPDVASAAATGNVSAERADICNQLRRYSTNPSAVWQIKVNLLPNSGVNFVPPVASAWNVASTEMTINIGRAMQCSMVLRVDGGWATEGYGRILRNQELGEAVTAHAPGRTADTGVTLTQSEILPTTNTWRIEIQPGSNAAGCTIYGLQAGQTEPNTVAYVELTGL